MSKLQIVTVFSESVAHNFFFLSKIYALWTNNVESFKIFGGGCSGQLSLKVWSQNLKFGPAGLFGAKNIRNEWLS